MMTWPTVPTNRPPPHLPPPSPPPPLHPTLSPFPQLEMWGEALRDYEQLKAELGGDRDVAAGVAEAKAGRVHAQRSREAGGGGGNADVAEVQSVEQYRQTINGLGEGLGFRV